MKKILIPDRSIETRIEQNVFGENYELTSPNASNICDIPDQMWHSCDGMLVWHDFNYGKEVINKLANCKGIVRVGAGYDNVDIQAAAQKNIIVSNVPDYGTNDVADHTWALILSLERGIIKFNNSMLNKGSWGWSLGKGLERIQEKTLGIIGLGRIGIAMAMRAKAFGMNIMFYDPYIPIGIEKSLGIKRVHELQGLLVKSDLITIHTPLNDETKGMVDSEFFNNMKNGASLYNTARGEIVVMDDLYLALKENKLKWAGLDVLETEPIDYKHKLINAWQRNEEWIKDRLVITPHTAFYNKQSYKEMREKAAKELKRILENNKPLNRVN
jgi:lactate dehydrogenase-like 2-hydroxyacid dehydrogenase